MNQFLLKTDHSPIKRRFVPAMSFAFLLLLASDKAMHYVVPGTLRSVLATVAGASFTAMMVFLLLIGYLACDEFQRKLFQQSLLWAALLVMAFCSIWGFLQFARMPLPEVPLALLPVAFLIATAAAKLIIFRRHAPGHDSGQ